MEYQSTLCPAETGQAVNLPSPKIPNIVLTTHFHIVKRILYTVFNLTEAGKSFIADDFSLDLNFCIDKMPKYYANQPPSRRLPATG
jgi:hypothetical protein